MFLFLFFSIVEQTFLYIPLALGAYVLFTLLKVPFIAIESAFTCGALVATKLFFFSPVTLPNLFLSVVVAFVAGSLVGLITCFIQYLTSASFLFSSLIVNGLFHGINQIILNKSTHLSVNHLSSFLTLIPSIESWPCAGTLLLIVGIISILYALLYYSSLGICFAFYGNNNKLFDHYDISALYIRTMGIFIGSGLAGISGYLIALNNGFADINMGIGVVLLSLIGLILGKVIIQKEYSLMLSVCGFFSYFFIQQYLLHIAFDARYLTMVKSILIFSLLYINAIYSQRRRSSEFGL